MTKIKVDADLTSFESELNKVRQSVSKINAALQGGGKVSESAASKELEALVKRADKLTATVEKLNKAGALNSKQAGDAAKHFDSMARAAGRLEKSADVKNAWASSWMRETAGEQRIRGQVLRNQPPANAGPANNKLIAGASTIAGSLIGGGNVGSLAGSLVGGLIGSLGGPVGTMIGSALGGALGGRAGTGLDEAKKTSLIIGEVRHSLGSLSTDFDTLRSSIIGLTGNLGIANGEAAALAKQFARTANVTSSEFGDIGESLRTSVGFGRGYGLSPSESSGFFGTARQYGVTKNDVDNRRMALMIGEAVNRGGNTAKISEVLSSVGDFVKMSTRRSLSSANVGEFISFLNSMTGTGIAGLKNDPTNAATAIGHADRSFRSGGAMGDASQGFLLHTFMQANPDLLATDLGVMLDQGLFGNNEKAFGKNSAAYKMADSRGDEQEKARLSRLVEKNQESYITTYLEALERETGGDTNMMRLSLKSQLGVSDSHAAALYSAFKQDSGLGGLNDALKNAGIDPDRINERNIGAFAEIAGAKPEDLDSLSLKMRGDMSDEDKTAIDESLANFGAASEEFRSTLLQIADKMDYRDVAEKSRDVMVDLSNSVENLMTNLVGVGVPLTNSILGLTKSVEKIAKVISGEFIKDWADTDFSLAEITGINSMRRMLFGDDESKDGKESKKTDDDSFLSKAWGFIRNDNHEYSAKRQYFHGLREYLQPANATGQTQGTDDAGQTQDAGDASEGKGYAPPPDNDWQSTKTDKDIASQLMGDLQKELGLTKVQAAGVVGNLSHETAGFKKMQEVNPLGGGRGGLGYAQWTGSRRSDFESHLSENGKAPDDYQANLDFLISELKTRERSALKALRETKTVDEAARVFSNKIDNTDPGDLSRKLQADLNNSIQGLTQEFVGVGKGLSESLTGLNNTLKPIVGWFAHPLDNAEKALGLKPAEERDFVANTNDIAKSSETASVSDDIGARLMRDLMREKKLSKIHAAAMVGNFMHETDGFKAMQEKNPINGGAGGFGFAHWTGPRRKQLEAWAAQKGLPVDSYEANKGFLYHEIEGPEKSAFQQLLKTNSLQEATMVFSDKFERPDKRYKRMDSRIRYAHAALHLAGDEMPAEQRRKESDKGMSFNANFNGEFRLRDMTGSEIADPLLITWCHSPRPAGAN